MPRTEGNRHRLPAPPVRGLCGRRQGCGYTVLNGKNILVLSAKEENYKGVAAGAGMAYGQKVGAESAVDINLAKQLNVLITQMGVNGENVAMNVGSAAAGYGFEYVVSTLERVYNTVRQGAITTEITEIVGGAAALED